MASEYPEHFVHRLEILWGRGFMSPGGASEVREIFKGLDVAGKRVLDIGCGIGGPGLVIAGELGAGSVTAVDVDAELLGRAAANAEEAGLKIDFRLIAPGPLPFADGSFDIVFSKEAFLHVKDKLALFVEIRRVLKPGGVLAASDWLAGENREASPEWAAYQRLASYSIIPATARECALMLEEAGFIHVSTRDRNAWYAKLAGEHLAQIEGPLKAELIAASSPEIYADWANMRRAQTAAVQAGAMRPTHLRGVKP
ncbi:class I SAM-dependent methyltransferase [Aestuariivirga sp.]|uniref:class I SAM-dependent methyltransferase n=1 Tax=Aestuariivirga sp. TaxID=2650926 RepID=UPI0039E219E9